MKTKDQAKPHGVTPWFKFGSLLEASSSGNFLILHFQKKKPDCLQLWLASLHQ